MFLEYLKYTYYTEAIAVMVALAGVIIYYKTQRDISLKPFTYYLLGYCALIFIVWGGLLFVDQDDWAHYNYLTSFPDYAFTICEFLIFHNYLSKTSLIAKKALRLMRASFLIIAIGLFLSSFLISKQFTLQYLYILFTLQAVFLITTSTIQLLSFFKFPLEINITKSSTFWITIGLLFFTLSTLPYSLFLILTTIDEHVSVLLFSLFRLFYILLFMLIIKAFLCKTTISNS